jgi:steroid 5-alpha reductase family enzyme
MTVPAFSPPIWGLIFVLSASVLLWLLSLRLKDASIADIFWGPGMAGVVDITAWLGHSGGTRASAVLLLVNLWAFRLAAHIWNRHANSKGEDRRYAEMRRHFGKSWWWLSLIQVFLLQAILIWFIPAPLVAALLYSHMPIGWMDWLGIGLAGAGLICETLADSQLAAFRLDPASRNMVMDRGLWAWSRHPNYFGECLLWWGCFLIGYGASHQVWLLLSPLLVTVLLLKVSGVSLMEESIAGRRPGYADYRRRVSTFIPWPPKRQAGRSP